jgi:hypothetical protein
MGRIPLSAPNFGGHVGSVLVEPGHGFWAVHGAFEGREGGVFERLQPKPVGGVVNQVGKALVAGALLQSVGDPRAGPSLPSDLHDAGRVGFLEPGCRVKLDRQGIIDRVACRADQGNLPVSPT